MGEELRAADGIIHFCHCNDKNVRLRTVAEFSYFGFLPFNAVGIQHCYSDVIRYFAEGDVWCARGLGGWTHVTVGFWPQL